MRISIITISGLPGSGKSTIADKVADRLSFGRYSSGDFMRELAHERGVTLAELSAQAEDNPEIDQLIDAKNKELVDAQNIVIDSRLAWYFIPDSFSIYLDIELDEAARQIHQDEKETRRKAGENRESLQQTKHDMLTRIESERRRYEALYGVDHTKKANYELVINTTDKKITEITNEVISTYEMWKKSQ
jgi:cytidylate kinase